MGTFYPLPRGTLLATYIITNHNFYLLYKTSFYTLQVVLGPEAIKGELNEVQFSTVGFGEDKLEGTLCCLQASERSYDQTSINLTFTSDVTFKLIQGSGPLSLIGQQLFGIENTIILYTSNLNFAKF